MKKTLLVVDDTPDITFTIKKLFEEIVGDYEVVVSETGEDCLKRLKEDFMPDAIILDIMLPGIDGWETYERIKKNELWSKIPIIILTAKTDHFTKGAGNQLADAFLEKPFELNDLKNSVEKVIANKSG
jgi:two-component system alkaline phosphatase synthesis response regulator PhoP